MTEKVETAVLSEKVRTPIEEVYLGNKMAFWKKYLSSRLSRYQYDVAMAGRPVSKETVDLIVEAYEKDLDRLWDILKNEFDGKTMAEYVKKELA